MKSLAEYLGAIDPRPEDKRPQDDYDAIIDASDPSDFCKKVVASREFRQYILSGIVLGDLAPAVMTRIIDHVWGKPAERIQIQEVHMLDGMTVDELKSHLGERVASLQTMMRMLDTDDEAVSVH